MAWNYLLIYIQTNYLKYKLQHLVHFVVRRWVLLTCLRVKLYCLLTHFQLYSALYFNPRPFSIHSGEIICEFLSLRRQTRIHTHIFKRLHWGRGFVNGEYDKWQVARTEMVEGKCTGGVGRKETHIQTSLTLRLVQVDITIEALQAIQDT